MRIIQATIPTLMIAIGVGLPPLYQSIFFHTFNVDYHLLHSGFHVYLLQLLQFLFLQ